MTNLIEKLVGDLGDKRRWRECKARVAVLPAPYRSAAKAVERYLMHLGSIDDDKWVPAFEDLAELWERAAADGTSVHDVVGDDPLAFVETFASNYGEGWRAREQRRFLSAIAEAEGASR